MKLLRGLGKLELDRVDFNRWVRCYIPSDPLAGRKEMVRFTPQEEVWFTIGGDMPQWDGTPVWDFGQPEHSRKMKNVIEHLKDFISCLKIYSHFLVYAIGTMSQFEYHLKKVVEIRCRKDKKRTPLAPLAEKFEEFQMHCNMFTALSLHAAGLAWHSPMMNRLLTFVNMELTQSQRSFLANNVLGAVEMERRATESSTTEVGTPQPTDNQSDAPDASQNLQENEDATEYTFMEQLNKRKPTQERGYLNCLKAEGDSLARRTLLWWRLVTFHIMSINGWRDMIVNTSARTIPQLSFSIIRIPKPNSFSGKPWRRLVIALTEDEDAVHAIEANLTTCGKQMLESNVSRHYHCEAVMCSLLFAARMMRKNPVDAIDNRLKDILQILSGAKPMIGASKRCCHTPTKLSLCTSYRLCSSKKYDTVLLVIIAMNLRKSSTRSSNNIERMREKRHAPASHTCRSIVNPYRRILPRGRSISTKSRIMLVTMCRCDRVWGRAADT
ncbi:hypothetical protein BDD12DRAFT_436327 [Trichophaea hybrida]|nr:hypothetical protein BDD12DRAFT_436327 [Trichophaea hybrida]